MKSNIKHQTNRRQSQAKEVDLYNTGMPGDNPFQSMYQATIGSQARAQTTRGGRQTSATPAIKSHKAKFGGINDLHRGTENLSKSAAKLNFHAKREQPRKFGEFHGEDGLVAKMPTTSIWSNTCCRFTHLNPSLLLCFFFSSMKLSLNLLISSSRCNYARVFS